MNITPAFLAKIEAVRTALLAAEKAHSGSRNLKVLHARLEELMTQATADGLMSTSQYQAMGGGTDKSAN